MSRRVALYPLLALALLPLAACDEPRAAGDQHAIIVATSEDLWFQIEETVHEALEPTILTVRDERTFRVTHQDPEGQDWGRLQRLRQVLVVGTGEEPWTQEALDRVRPRRDDFQAPEILQAENVWARGQRVTIMLVPEGREAEAVEELGPDLHALLDSQFRQYALSRMFASGRDTILADSLMQNVGFSVVLPNVYRYSVLDSVFRFRNDNPSPSELIRELAVTWKTPIPDEVTEEDLVEWREILAREYYPDDQLINLARSAANPFSWNGRDGFQLQASWETAPGEWPAAGPFITQALPCPEQDRLYVVDAWLYAPGRDKYEYMIQLETILNSFRCG